MANEQDTGKGPHGHSNPTYRGCYRRGCRCNECVEAHRLFRRQWLARRIAREPDYQSKTWKKLCESELGKAGIERRRKVDRERIKTPSDKRKSVNKSRRRCIKRREYLAAIKLERGCKDCGYRKHPSALDFDHISGEKIMGVSAMSTYSIDRIMAEAAKCDVVCFNCHRIRERKRMLNGELSWAPKRKTDPTRKQARTNRCRDRGRLFLSQAKLNSGCADCGYSAHAEAIDFDHVRGTKDFSLAAKPGASIDTLKAEIAKCDVVCANCHRIRTFNRHQERKAELVVVA